MAMPGPYDPTVQDVTNDLTGFLRRNLPRDPPRRPMPGPARRPPTQPGASGMDPEALGRALLGPGADPETIRRMLASIAQSQSPGFDEFVGRTDPTMAALDTKASQIPSLYSPPAEPEMDWTKGVAARAEPLGMPPRQLAGLGLMGAGLGFGAGPLAAALGGGVGGTGAAVLNGARTPTEAILGGGVPGAVMGPFAAAGLGRLGSAAGLEADDAMAALQARLRGPALDDGMGAVSARGMPEPMQAPPMRAQQPMENAMPGAPRWRTLDQQPAPRRFSAEELSKGLSFPEPPPLPPAHRMPPQGEVPPGMQGWHPDLPPGHYMKDPAADMLDDAWGYRPEGARRGHNGKFAGQHFSGREVYDGLQQSAGLPQKSLLSRFEGEMGATQAGAPVADDMLRGQDPSDWFSKTQPDAGMAGRLQGAGPQQDKIMEMLRRRAPNPMMQPAGMPDGDGMRAFFEALAGLRGR